MSKVKPKTKGTSRASEAKPIKARKGERARAGSWGSTPFTHYVKVAFFRGSSLRPVPPGPSKDKDTRSMDIHAGELDEAQMATWVKQAAALPGWVPGRPSLLEGRADKRGGAVVATGIGGSSVLVSEGVIHG